MRAAVCSDYGTPEVITIEALPSLPLEAGQIRIRIESAAVNFSDVLLVANKYQVTVPTPFTPGSEFAGVVAEVADGVDTVSVGDRVTGTGFVGAFAEEIIIASDKLTLGRIPDGVETRVAAAFGVAHRTAYHTLRSVAHLKSGDELIVLGAGGGVGIAPFSSALHSVQQSPLWRRAPRSSTWQRRTVRVTSSTIAPMICARL